MSLQEYDKSFWSNAVLRTGRSPEIGLVGGLNEANCYRHSCDDRGDPVIVNQDKIVLTSESMLLGTLDVGCCTATSADIQRIQRPSKHIGARIRARHSRRQG
jgi:hypothetical protein